MPITSLKTGTDPVPALNAIIDPVWIPTFPAKLRFAAVAAVPTTLIWSVIDKPGNTRSYNTVSELKSDNKPESIPFASWNTDLISSIVYVTIDFIDGFSYPLILSLITNCSPTINFPVVWDTTISLDPVEPPFLAAKPSAPLERPLIYIPFTTPDDVKVLHFNTVNVWIS